MKRLIPFLLLLVTACIKTQRVQTAQLSQLTPPDVVKTFVQLSASATQLADKKVLLEATGGDLRKAFERMTDEEFKLTYMSGQLKVEKVDILEATVQNDTAKVRYLVVIENAQGTETTQEANEREAELNKTPSGWVVGAIRLKGSDKIAFTRGMIF